MSWLNAVSRTFFTRCAGAVASLGYGLLLAVVLAPDAMGELAVAVSVALIAATISKCGLDAYLMRRVAQSADGARSIAARCLAAAGIAGAIAWAVCVWVGFGIGPGIALTFSVFQLAIPFLAMSFVLTGLLKAGNFPAMATFLETGCWQSILCVCAIFMGYVGSDSLLAAAICFAAGSALAFAVFLPPAFRLVFAQELSRRRKPAAAPALFRQTAPFAGVAIAHVLIRWSDTLWLAFWLDTRSVAVYTVCTRVAGGIVFVGEAVIAVAAPRFARHHGRGKMDMLHKDFYGACAVSGACGFLSAAALALLAPVILGRLGAPYADFANILQLAGVLTAAHVTLMPVAHLAAMSGRAADHLKASAVTLALQQIAYLLLIPRFGMMAALCGFALPQALAALLTLAMLRRRRDIGLQAR